MLTILGAAGGLLGKIPLRAWLLGLLGGVIALVVYLGYHHYESVLSENATLRQNEVTYKAAILEQDRTIQAAEAALQAWKTSAASYGQAVQENADAQRAAAAELRRLDDVSSRHDLGSLAARKPALVEPAINRGADRARRLLECASGAKGDDCPR